MSSGNGAATSQYQFLPWIRRGASALIAAPDSLQGPLPPRANLAIDLTVEGIQGGNSPSTADITAAAQVLGPGDVLGIDRSHIVKTEPVDRTNNFEPNYFAAVEFDQIDFPWMFTPGAPNENNQLMPWIALIVLASDEFDVPKSQSGNLPSIIVHDPKSVLPKLSELWSWAHVQISGPMPSASEFDSTLQNLPGIAISRLICPRQLSPSTSYKAFLVPAFDAGVAVGLGQPTPSSSQLALAWNQDTQSDLALPVYFQFQFQTSDQGDFESLVRRLHREILPADVGMRQMDVSQCDETGAVPPPSVSPLGMQGALQSPLTSATTYPNNGPDDFQKKLADLLDQTSSDVYDDSTTDPKVLPPFYGHWYVGQSQVSSTDNTWLSTLDLDPRNRAAAGLGTQVVLRQLRSLVASAWTQAGALPRANEILNLGQYSRAVLTGALNSNFAQLQDEAAIAVTSPVHSRITSSPQTVSSQIQGSALPSLTLSAPFRRAFRPLGPIRRRQPTASSNPPYAVIKQLNAGEIQPTPPMSPPSGIKTMGEASQALEPSGFSAWLHPILPYLTSILIGIGILAFILIGVLGALFSSTAFGLTIGAIVLGILGGFSRVIKPIIEKATVAAILQPSNFSPQSVHAVGSQPNFIVLKVGASSPRMPSGTGAADSADARAFRATSLSVTAWLQASPPDLPARLPLASLTSLKATILQKLDPSVTVANRVMSLIQLNPNFQRAPGTDPLRQIMWAPNFPQPMYLPLAQWSQDLLLPGVGKIPPESIALLIENRTFIESYMVGLNEEIERQLLWNGFPTDQRGTCFRQFWDISGYIPPPKSDADREALYDISPVSSWTPTSVALGNHPSNTNTNEPSLILLVQGELLKRYPRTQIYATPAVAGNPPETPLKIIDPNGPELTPIYQGQLTPDLRFFGFNLTKAMVLGNDPNHSDGWFFVFQQIPGEPRFGLEPDNKSRVAPLTWAKLSWQDFIPVPAFASPNKAPASYKPTIGLDAQNSWGTNSAQMAYITMRHPERVAYLASDLLPQDSDTGMKLIKTRMQDLATKGLVALQGAG